MKNILKSLFTTIKESTHFIKNRLFLSIVTKIGKSYLDKVNSKIDFTAKLYRGKIFFATLNEKSNVTQKNYSLMRSR